MIPRCVLDASALLAFLQDERGSKVVDEWLPEGSLLGAANLTEVLDKLAMDGQDVDDVWQRLHRAGLFGQLVVVEPVLPGDAVTAARLRRSTAVHGLSLGDRLCIALAVRRELPVLTADRVWTAIDAGVEVIAIR